jgi:hypothetical protein
MYYIYMDGDNDDDNRYDIFSLGWRLMDEVQGILVLVSTHMLYTVLLWCTRIGYCSTHIWDH